MRSRRPPGTQSVVVVTGASSGVGLATALAFADAGAELVLSSRNAAGLRTVETDCRTRGASTVVVVADVTAEEEVAALAAAAVARFGRIDVWVNTAAVVAYGRFEDVPPEVYRRVLDVGIAGATSIARHALRQFRRQGYGKLIFLGSVLGEIATPYLSSYVTTKWALRGFARELAIETRDNPAISVCVVSPGGVDTPVYRQAANYVGRIGRPPPPMDPPEKVARAILRCAHRPRARTSVGLANPIIRFGFTFLPGVFDALVTPLMRLGGLSREATAPTSGNVFTPVPAREAVSGGWGRHRGRERVMSAAGQRPGTDGPTEYPPLPPEGPETASPAQGLEPAQQPPAGGPGEAADAEPAQGLGAPDSQ